MKKSNKWRRYKKSRQYRKMQNDFSDNKRTGYLHTRYENTLRWWNMKNEIRKVTYKILKEDIRAREDDNYLILRVIEKLEPELAKRNFPTVMENLKDKRISLESITRARRKFFEEYPQLRVKNVDNARRNLEKEYIKEYGGNKWIVSISKL